MKILILTNEAGGLYNFRKELISELISRGHSVIVSTPPSEKCYLLEKSGCTIIPTHINRRGINPFSDLKLLLFYKRIIKKHKPDYVLTYTIKPNIYMALNFFYYEFYSVLLM